MSEKKEKSICLFVVRRIISLEPGKEGKWMQVTEAELECSFLKMKITGIPHNWLVSTDGAPSLYYPFFSFKMQF